MHVIARQLRARSVCRPAPCLLRARKDRKARAGTLPAPRGLYAMQHLFGRGTTSGSGSLEDDWTVALREWNQAEAALDAAADRPTAGTAAATAVESRHGGDGDWEEGKEEGSSGSAEATATDAGDVGPAIPAKRGGGPIRWLCYCVASQPPAPCAPPSPRQQQQRPQRAARRERRTYVGATVNFDRRLRQHNGEIKGGASYTRTGSGWQPVWLVHGFRSQRECLQFEWAVKVRAPTAPVGDLSLWSRLSPPRAMRGKNHAWLTYLISAPTQLAARWRQPGRAEGEAGQGWGGGRRATCGWEGRPWPGHEPGSGVRCAVVPFSRRALRVVLANRSLNIHGRTR
jgi:predicted GIY-YIG superfamily endonuclease